MIKKFGAVIIILNILFILICNLTFISAEDGENDIKEISELEIIVLPNKIHTRKIDTDGGDVIYDWTITGYIGDKTRFIIRGEDFIAFESNNLTSKNDTIKDIDAGEYIFEWHNKDSNSSFTLSYTITYPKKTYEESIGCYSAVFLLSLSSMGVVGVVVVKKKIRDF
jgi:hypothetical protein